MISLLIPTLNRPAFINRLLNYYSHNYFEGNILIGDSSKDNNLTKNINTIKSFEKKLNIFHYHYPNHNPAQAYSKLLNEVNTDYVAIVMDDDYLVPKSINKCINYLENHKDYSSANGIGIKIYINNDKICGNLINVHSYPQYRLGTI